MSAFDEINPALIDQPLPSNELTDGQSGYPDDLAFGDTVDALKAASGEASREFPESLWIEPRDWADKARDNDKYKTWPINYVDRFTNQTPTHECTCHSLRAGFECARNRARGISFPDGPKKDFRYEESASGSVWVSPLSVYAEANPRQWGGASIRGVMEIAVRRGFLPEKIQPKEYNFAHSLQGTTGRGGKNQASGDWVSVSRFPEGWKETAKHFRILEVIYPDSFEQAVCLLLNGYMVHVGRSGHAVPWGLVGFSGNDVSNAPYPDSYDVIRYDSVRTMKSAWRGSFSIATVTCPDDWMKPAGG